jgi:hypothetical protein
MSKLLKKQPVAVKIKILHFTKKLAFFLGIFLLSILVVAVIKYEIAGYVSGTSNSGVTPLITDEIAIASPDLQTKISSASRDSRVAGESDKRVALAASENFEAASINVGDNALTTEDHDSLPLEISDFKSESLHDSSGRVKIVLSWQTSKPAVSEINYSSGGSTNKVIKEDSYESNHNLIVSDVETQAAYVFRIICKDHWGNEKESDSLAVYMAGKPISVFDAISNSLNGVFGWAIKK